MQNAECSDDCRFHSQDVFDVSEHPYSFRDSRLMVIQSRRVAGTDGLYNRIRRSVFTCRSFSHANHLGHL